MPKTNHNRQFSDERDYSVCPGDWACGKHGAANQRRGAKKGINRVNRARATRLVQGVLSLVTSLSDGVDDVHLTPKPFKEVNLAHDYEGKAKYVRY